MKDTIREFDGYIDEYNTKSDNGTLKAPSYLNDDGAIDEDDDGEEDYTAEDVVHVRKCLGLFIYVRDVLILVLNVFTLIGDHSVNLSDGNLENLQVWNAKVCLFAKRIQDAVTNAGAELYPPLEDVEIEAKYQLVVNLLVEYFSLLKSEGVVEILLDINVDLHGKLNRLHDLLSEIS